MISPTVECTVQYSTGRAWSNLRAGHHLHPSAENVCLPIPHRSPLGTFPPLLTASALCHPACLSWVISQTLSPFPFLQPGCLTWYNDVQVAACITFPSFLLRLSCVPRKQPLFAHAPQGRPAGCCLFLTWRVP